MQHDAEAATVVLSPHLDDSVLSTWHVLRGIGEVEVLCVCAAIPAPGTAGRGDRLFGCDDSTELMRQRRLEDHEALGLAGRKSTSLEMLDGQYRADPLSPDLVAGAATSSAPRASRLYAPMAIGDHPDHVAVRTAAVGLARGGGIPLTLYADLPYAARLGWPSWVTGVLPRPYLVPDANWPDVTGILRVGPDQVTRRPVCLSAAEMDLKLAALQRYRTQFEMLNSGPIGVLTNPEVLAFELYWDVDHGGPDDSQVSR